MADRLSKDDLFDLVVNAIRSTGWNVLFLPRPNDPSIRLQLYRGHERRQIRVYIWNVTPGGKNRPEWEYRIQVTGAHQHQLAQDTGEETLILGWWQPAGVFVGFDFKKHSGPLGSSPSFQVSEDTLRRAATNDFAPYDKGNGEIAIAFRPDFFGEYMAQKNTLHEFGESQTTIQALDALAQDPQSVTDEVLSGLNEPRRIALRSVRERVRDARFRQRVLDAYDHHCSVCGMQLEIVEAAHIVPVPDSRSTDHVTNGVALCVLHHEAYDSALVTITDTYRIAINEAELARLRAANRIGGIDLFESTLKQSPLRLPTDPNNRPSIGMIKIANDLRGWSALHPDQIRIL